MNAKQRRKEKRYRLGLADRCLDILDGALSDIETGKSTPREIREDIIKLRLQLLEERR